MKKYVVTQEQLNRFYFIAHHAQDTNVCRLSDSRLEEMQETIMQILNEKEIDEHATCRCGECPIKVYLP